MEFIPADAHKSIEFDKVLELIQSLCIAQPAKAMIEHTPFMHEKDPIKAEMYLVKDYKIFLDQDLDPPLAHYEDVKESLNHLSTQGYVLELSEIREIQQLISIVFEVDAFFTSERREKTPKLYELLDILDRPTELRTIIPKVINEEGEVRENASPELSKIYKSIRLKEQNVQTEFNSILTQDKHHGTKA